MFDDRRAIARRCWHGLGRPMAVAIVAIALVSCGVWGVGATPPPPSVVERAVVLSALRARATLVDRLGGSDRWDEPLEPEDAIDAAAALGVEVARVRSRERVPLTIGSRPGYRVRGTYELRSRAAGDGSSPGDRGGDNAFEIYLQLQAEGKTWRLAYPDATAPDGDRRWLTDRLQ